MSQLLNRLEAKVEATRTVWDDALLASIRKPIRFLIWVVGVAWAADVISLRAETGFREMIDPIRYVMVVGILVLLSSEASTGKNRGCFHTQVAGR